MSKSKSASSHLERALLATVLSVLPAVNAHAAPPELFSRITVSSANSDLLALPYYFGGSGMLLSADAGMTFSLLCSSAVDSSLVREEDAYTTLFGGAGAIHLAGPTGIWSGTQNGCGWTESPELKGKWVADLAADPVDPKRSFAATSITGEANAIWTNDGASKAWTMLGAPVQEQLAWLRVAKTTTGKLFYARGVQVVSGMNRYVIRVSEDEGKTWMEHEFPRPEAQDVRILAVDPTDPNRIVVSVVMDTNKLVLPNPPDELWISPMRGAAGSFTKLTQVGVLHGTVFTPDGALYYGDDATDTPGLYVIKKLGEMPAKLLTNPISCLGYDGTRQRLYACSGYEFGMVDLASNTFQSLIDKRKVSQFVECPGEAPMAMRCKEQMAMNYCGYGHYWQAPICAGYMLPGSPFDPMLSATGMMSAAGAGTAATPPPSAGNASPLPAGTGAAGSIGVSGTGATAPGAAAAPATPPASSSSGCACALTASEPQTRGLWLLSLSALAAIARRRRQK